MIDRRSFMSGAAIVVAAAVLPVRAGVGALALAASPAIVLVDRHLDGSERFAASARARGVRVLDYDSDVAALWMRELEPRLRAGPTVFAGRTSAATAFCLDLLARDYGASIVQRVDSARSVEWTIASSALRRAPLAPPSRRSAAHA